MPAASPRPAGPGPGRATGGRGARATPAGSPAPMARPPTLDLVLLGVAVVAVSTSAPLIRAADAPSLAVAFWRNALAVPVLGAVVLADRRGRREIAALDRRERRLSALAGLFLAAHFAVWVPSLSFTSVASSVALVATQPVWAALIARWRGDDVPRLAWWGIGSAMAGAVVLSGVDLSISPRALFGDLLAVCGLGRQQLVGYDRDTWLVLAAIVIGPQLLGHTLVNRVLRTTSPMVVSVAILFEIVGAALMAWVAFDEVPPASAVPAGVLIAVGVVLVVRSEPTEPTVAGVPPLA